MSNIYEDERKDIQNLITYKRCVSKVNYAYHLIKFPEESIPWLRKNGYILEKLDYAKDFYKISW